MQNLKKKKRKKKCKCCENIVDAKKEKKKKKKKKKKLMKHSICVLPPSLLAMYTKIKQSATHHTHTKSSQFVNQL